MKNNKIRKFSSKLLVSAAIAGMLGGVVATNALVDFGTTQTVQASAKKAKVAKKSRRHSKKRYQVGEIGDCNLTYVPQTKTVHISAYGKNNELLDPSANGIADEVNGAKLGKGRHLQVSDIKHISIDTPIAFADYSNNLFANFANLRDIKGLNKIYTGKCTQFEKTFANDPKLKKLDLSSWSLYKLQHDSEGTTYHMFFGDSGLTELNLTGWDISNVDNAKGMFDGVNKAAIKGLIQKTPSHDEDEDDD